MLPRDLRYSRRKFLASAAAVTIGGGISPSAHPSSSALAIPKRDGRAPIAVFATVYRPLSYAYHLVGRFLHGYPRNGEHHLPAQYVHSLWVEQSPDNDLSRALARSFDFRRARTVREALLANDRLAVKGVLLIGEHGNYPRNEKGQILYPRFEIFEQVVEVFRHVGRSVPVFCAKHLSYSWDKACRMVAAANEVEFPLLAGSTLPTTWRRPEIDWPLGAAMDEALVVGHGPIEVAGFDALDALQCMAERRNGGETGVRAVTCLSGSEVWQAGDAGRWSLSLLEAALARCESANLGDARQNCGRIALPSMPATPPVAFLIEYADGTRGSVLLLNGHVQEFAFAARGRGEPQSMSCLFHLPLAPGSRHFDGQAAAIERLIADGHSEQPIERSLLTTGILDALMDSHYQRGQRIETPHLMIRYDPPQESKFLRGPVA